MHSKTTGSCSVGGFIEPAMPENEKDRVEALGGLRILDTPPEERYDRIVRLAAQLFDMPIAYISLVDRDRQWFKSKVGTETQQTPRNISFCGHAILQDDALVIPNALEDERFAGNPMVVGEPFVRFYAGYPVREPDGFKIGTLCLMDKKKREFGTKDRNLLRQLAQMVEHEFKLIGTIGLQQEMLKVKEALIETQKHLAAEKEKSDRLLLNILPAKVAEELKNKGRVAAEHHQDVCVLFADFTDFTSVAQKFSANELVDELNTCFSQFDEITVSHGVEKLKTIGDGYLCVAGLPEFRESAPLDLLSVAMEIRQYVEGRKARFQDQGRPYWNVRIGLHAGPLVAGVVGVRKFAFDVWGDTVNIASRLETASEPGKINVSKEFYDRVKNQVEVEPRGKLAIKGKGEIEMYFVRSLK